MPTPLFIDSWGWITLANRQEQAHTALTQFYRREMGSGSSIVTSDYVLDEVITFLYAKLSAKQAQAYLEPLFASIKSGAIQQETITEKRFEKTWKMRLKYSDHPRISFTDLSSFVVMQELHITRVVTADHHFSELNLGFERYPS